MGEITKANSSGFDKDQKTSLENFYNLLLAKCNVLEKIEKDIKKIEIGGVYSGYKSNYYKHLNWFDKNLKRTIDLFKIKMDHNERGMVIYNICAILVMVDNYKKSEINIGKDLDGELIKIENKKEFLKKSNNDWTSYFGDVEKSLKTLKKKIDSKNEILDYIKDDTNNVLGMINVSKKELKNILIDDEPCWGDVGKQVLEKEKKYWEYKVINDVDKARER